MRSRQQHGFRVFRLSVIVCAVQYSAWECPDETAAGRPIVLTAFLADAPAHAGDPAAKAPEPVSAPAEPLPWLLGDWNGARTRLRDRGIDFQFGYTSEFAYNATGGIESKAAYADQYAVGDDPRPRPAALHPRRAVPGHHHRAHRPQSERRRRTRHACSRCRRCTAEDRPIRLTDFWYQQKFADGLAGLEGRPHALRRGLCVHFPAISRT